MVSVDLRESVYQTQWVPVMSTWWLAHQNVVQMLTTESGIEVALLVLQLTISMGSGTDDSGNMVAAATWLKIVVVAFVVLVVFVLFFVLVVSGRCRNSARCGRHRSAEDGWLRLNPPNCNEVFLGLTSLRILLSIRFLLLLMSWRIALRCREHSTRFCCLCRQN